MRKVVLALVALCAAAIAVCASPPRASALVPVISAGASHTLCVRNNGTLWSWGSGSNGRLGNGGTSSNTVPTQVGSLATWVDCAAGSAHSLGLRSDGTLWAWGQNSNGQLGLGNTTQQTSPTQIGTGTTWADMSAGGSHSLAIKTDGTLWAWGLNSSGQLGLGNTTQQTSPTQVGAATNWAFVAAGYNYSLAIKTNGTLWAWGQNSNGQLGLGNTTSPYTSPTQVGSATTWRWVSAANGTSNWFSLGVRSDGTLWSWGTNSNGQLGLGNTTSPYTSPTQVGTGTTWYEAYAGSNFSLLLRSDRTAWSCGLNSSYQLGLGNTTQYSSPQQITTGPAAWAMGTAGTSFGIAYGYDGNVYGWGLNSSYQLGLGNTATRTTPTALSFSVFPSSGSLSVGTPTTTDFTGVTLSGVATTTTASLGTIPVTDATTTTPGWHLTVSASQFTNGTDLLDTSSLTVSAPTAVSHSYRRTLGPQPTPASGGPFIIDSGSAVTLASAATYTMGSYTIGSSPLTLTLTFPASAYAGTYSTVITLTGVTGP